MTDKQANEVQLMVKLVKLLIGAAFALGGWQMYVTVTLNQHTAEIAEVKASALVVNNESSARLRDYQIWREDVTKIITRQTTLLEGQQWQLAHMQDAKK